MNKAREVGITTEEVGERLKTKKTKKLILIYVLGSIRLIYVRV